MRQCHVRASAESPSGRRIRHSRPPNSGHPVSQSRRLLWVDDSRPLLSLYKSVFETFGFEVVATSSPAEALTRVSLERADVAILDYDMPEMNGVQLVSLLKYRHPTLPVILYTGSACIPEGAHHSVDAVCAKAAPREELLTTIERVTRSWGSAQGVATPS